MSYVTVEQAKLHLLVIHDADDELIQQNIDAAEMHAANYMNRPDIADDPVNPWRRNQGSLADWLRPLNECHPHQAYYQSEVVSSEQSDPVPKSVVQAVLLLTADFYENRVPASMDAMSQTKNSTAEALLWAHRVGMGV